MSKPSSYFWQALRENIEETQFDLGEVQQTGEQLMNLCGEPDRPEVQKNIDDLDTNLRTINSDFEKRSRSLEDALERSLQFQDELMVRCTGSDWNGWMKYFVIILSTIFCIYFYYTFYCILVCCKVS